MNNTLGSTLYWRLSSYYFFYFAALGALLPYWNPYLQSIGLDYAQIGVLSAILLGTKIIAPLLWGWLADHSGKRIVLIRSASLLTVLIFAGVLWTQDFVWLAVLIFWYGFFWNAGLPQFEATTLSHLGDKLHLYSSVRLWGSFGFVVIVLCLGPLLDQWGISSVPAILVALFAGIWLATLWVPDSEVSSSTTEPASSLWETIRKPVVISILSLCFIMQLSHGPYYTFYSIYLETFGYSKSLVGTLWALGVIAEIVVFVVMHRLLPSLGSKWLLILCFVLTALRWLLIAYGAEQVGILLFAQLLHAFSFGAFHAVMIHLIHMYFKGKHQGRGQALYSSLSFGAGGAMGALLSGYYWDVLGPQWVLNIASIVSLLGVLIVFAGFRQFKERF